MRYDLHTNIKSMTDSEFVAEARRRCELTIANTGAGKWLQDALRRIEGHADSHLPEKARQVAGMEDLKHNEGAE